jgi:RHS repeat-associated protein
MNGQSGLREFAAHSRQPGVRGHDLFGGCKGSTIHYDYDGLSQNVLAVREGPYWCLFPAQDSCEWITEGDQFISSFVHGPTGVVIRTDEALNNDPADNEHHFYLPDAHGGNVAMLVYNGNDREPAFQQFDAFGVAQTGRLAGAGGDREPAFQQFDAFRVAQTGRLAGAGGDREPAFQQFDAFGVPQTSRLTDAGMYAWRGGEGSETEILNSGAGQAAGQDWPNLILMQARHYDPQTGRFMQADPLKMSSFTTQGLNRYIYCNNDPVNMTDPTGLFIPIFAFVVFMALINGLSAFAAGGGCNLMDFVNGFLLGLISGIAALLGPWGLFLGGFLAGFLGSIINGDSVWGAVFWGLIGTGLGALGSAAGANINKFVAVLAVHDISAAFVLFRYKGDPYR